jgi:hypothetical protein
MAQLEKLVASFLRCSGTFAWLDFVRMLNGLGYQQIKKGKTSGSGGNSIMQPAAGLFGLMSPTME